MLERLNWAEVATCASNRWSPQIGDPNATGWATVGAYLVCSFLAVRVAMRVGKGRERQFWVLMAIVMTILAINKQLDLQSALTAVGRCLSQLQGWYEERSGIQRLFIEGLLIATVAGFAVCLYLMRRNLGRNGLAILGLTMVAAFVAVRAVGFHHFDSLINTRIMDLRFNFIFENSGLVLIALNAIGLLALVRRT